ncbi:MAG TPA: iron-sulfur cluster insertion protein ErpA [Rhodanobacteraceae bacterium]
MNTASAAVSKPALSISDAALARVRELIREGNNPALKLRVSIEGGGCSGFQYDVNLDDKQADDDFVLDRDGVALLVDPVSMQYLEGAEVDYVEQLSGAQFVIHNPNAKKTCGCGSSFTA